MANGLSQQLGLRAKVEPSVDRASKRKLTQDVEDAIGDAESGVGGGVMDRTSASAGGGGSGGGGGGAAAGAGLASRAGSVGGAAKMLGTVALGGVVAAGMLKAMESASGRLQGVKSIFGSASKLFFKPFGDKLAEALLPFAEDGLTMAKNFNEIYEDQGLAVAIHQMNDSIIDRIGSTIGGAAADLVSGDVDLPDFTWGNFVSALKWARYVSGLVWAAHVTDVAWETFIDEVGWDSYIPSFGWSSWVDDLAWTRYITGLGWGAYVADLTWQTFVSKIDWSDFIPFLGDGGGDGGGSSSGGSDGGLFGGVTDFVGDNWQTAGAGTWALSQALDMVDDGGAANRPTTQSTAGPRHSAPDTSGQQTSQEATALREAARDLRLANDGQGQTNVVLQTERRRLGNATATETALKLDKA